MYIIIIITDNLGNGKLCMLQSSNPEACDFFIGIIFIDQNSGSFSSL